MIKFWFHLRWQSWVAIGLLIAHGLYRNHPDIFGWGPPLDPERGGFGCPLHWKGIGGDGQFRYDPSAMLLDVAFYAVLAKFTALQIEHWARNQDRRFRFSMRSMFIGVTALGIALGAAPLLDSFFMRRWRLLDFPIAFAMFAVLATTIRWLNNASKDWQEPIDEGEGEK